MAELRPPCVPVTPRTLVWLAVILWGAVLLFRLPEIVVVVGDLGHRARYERLLDRVERLQGELDEWPGGGEVP